MRLLNSKKRRRAALALVSALGAMLFLGAQVIATRQPAQVDYYNQGVALMHKGDLADAMKSFNSSLAAYQQEKHPSWQERRIAALAAKNEGLIYIVAQKPEGAVAAFKQSLAINDGTGFGPGAAVLHEDAITVQYDLELLYKKNPSLQQAEGKNGGQGKQQGQGQKPAPPGNDPSQLPGKGNRNAI